MWALATQHRQVARRSPPRLSPLPPLISTPNHRLPHCPSPEAPPPRPDSPQPLAARYVVCLDNLGTYA